MTKQDAFPESWEQDEAWLERMRQFEEREHPEQVRADKLYREAKENIGRVADEIQLLLATDDSDRLELSLDEIMHQAVSLDRDATDEIIRLVEQFLAKVEVCRQEIRGFLQKLEQVDLEEAKKRVLVIQLKHFLQKQHPFWSKYPGLWDSALSKYQGN